MNRTRLFSIFLFTLVIWESSFSKADDFTFFESKIRPVLVESCYECHAQGKKVRGGLLLDSKIGLEKGGDSGPTISPLKPGESLLIKALNHHVDIKMPPKGKLSSQIIKDFELWVSKGAPDPRNGSSTFGKNEIDWGKAREFWSLKPRNKIPLPTQVITENPIDSFIITQLKSKGLKPSSQAEPKELIRRLSFTLTGLPPSVQDVLVFEKNHSDAAYNQLVEKYLSTREYAEKWARHWLDVARYAEDQAHTFGVKPNSEAWKYRDWVISAMEKDMPYDQFVRYQIAADFFPEPARKENLAALGFFGLGAQYYKNSDAARAIADELDDRVDTLTRGFLGLTVSCARCHDHKYDPIPTQDYYSIAGVFQSSKLNNTPQATAEEAQSFEAGKKKLADAEFSFQSYLRTAKQPFLEKKCGDIPARLLEVDAYLEKKPGLNPQGKGKQGLDSWAKFLEKNKNDKKFKFCTEPWTKLIGSNSETEKNNLAENIKTSLLEIIQQENSAFTQKKQDKAKQEILSAFFDENGLLPLGDSWKKDLPKETLTTLNRMEEEFRALKQATPENIAMVHAITENSPIDLKVYIRGNPANQGPLAPRRFIRAIAGDNPPLFKNGSGRLELANCIVDSENPLTSRVMANRIWAWSFGRGLVNTPSNFGFLGDKPTHPELLDWLANYFVDSKWSIKSMNRLIVSSKTFKQSSKGNSNSGENDPANIYLWKFNRKRLDVESWRDSVLAVAGSLENSTGGPTFNLNDSGSNKRTIYAKISRHELHPLLRLFDFPDPNITSEKRVETTIPQQQLFMINSPFVIQQSKHLAHRLKSGNPNIESQVKQAYQLAYARLPDQDELGLAVKFLEKQDDVEEQRSNRQDRLERFCQALFASNEFLFID